MGQLRRGRLRELLLACAAGRWLRRIGWLLGLGGRLERRLAGLLWLGMTGPRDPLTNPLPLTIWVVWWIGLVPLQGLWGNLWRWIDPWRGVLALIRAQGARAPLSSGPVRRAATGVVPLSPAAAAR